MKIYIDNFDLDNRGNQLMIQSVIDQIRSHYGNNAQIFVCERVFIQNPSYCFTNKLYPLAATNTGKRHMRLVKKLTNSLLGDNWIVTPNEIDVVLNCLGYCYSDHFITEVEEYWYYAKNYYAAFSKTDRKIILLPQAFGPYENEWSKKTMLEVYEMVDKIFCRDSVSYNHLQNILPDINKISMASDFTCLCKPTETPSVLLPEKQYVVLVPNFNMLRYIDKEIYLNYLQNIVECINLHSYQVYLLNHEGEKDLEILQELNARLKNQKPIITNLSAFEYKSVIQHCRLLVSDRFHALVSGLTQGVPCLYAGWSYKYEELCKEHNCDCNKLDIHDLNATLHTISDAITNPDKYKSKEGCEKILETNVLQMWKEVFDLLDSAISR